jgi:hypothetical protein
LREKRGGVQVLEPGSYAAPNSHYPRVCNAAQHPVVSQFMSLSRSAMIARYCALHPDVTEASLSSVLRHVPQHFRWAGCDLFVCGPRRRTLVVETNSCPSGQKSLPFKDGDELNGYGRLMRSAFRSLLPGALAAAAEGAAGAEAGGSSGGGVYAVLYDKNEMEARGYAGALAELTGENVETSALFRKWIANERGNTACANPQREVALSTLTLVLHLFTIHYLFPDCLNNYHLCRCFSVPESSDGLDYRKCS